MEREYVDFPQFGAHGMVGLTRKYVCRGCGALFVPYMATASPTGEDCGDADYCPSCARENAGDPLPGDAAARRSMSAEGYTAWRANHPALDLTVPEGCTGYTDPEHPAHGIQHDGPTCPVHEVTT